MPAMKVLDFLTDGSFVYGLRIQYYNTNWVTQAKGFDFNPNLHQVESMKLNPNEYITKIGVRGQKHVQSVLVVTNLGNRVRFGQKAQPETMVPLPANAKVLTLEPFVGGHLQGFNIVFSPL